MRVDFEQQQFKSDDDQKMLRLMRGARAVAASIVIAGLGAAALSTAEAPEQPGTVLNTDREYATGAPVPAFDEPRAPIG